jgi:hypothetical protein
MCVNNLLQQGLIGLQVACTCVKTYDAHEHILVVGKIGNGLEVINMIMLVQSEQNQCIHITYIVHTMYEQVFIGMYIHVLCMYSYLSVCTYLRRLTRGVVRIPPQNDLPYLVKNAVRLLKIPFGLFARLIRQVLLQDVKEINCLLLQVGKLCLGDKGLASSNVPVHAMDENFHHIIAWIRNMRQPMQKGARLGVVDSSIGELHLWLNKITNHEGYCEHQPLHAIASHLCIFLAINVNVMEMCSVISAQGDHGGVCHDSCKPTCLPL